MGKTYRKEKQYKKARDADESTRGKAIDHDHERVERRRRLREVQQDWDDDANLDDLDQF